MSTIKIQYPDRNESFENVTKILFINNTLFDSYLVIHQGKKRTKINTTNISNFEILEEKS